MKLFRIVTPFVVVLLVVFFFFKAFAATSYNASDIIDDGIFNNTSSMNIAQINAFLNNFPNSCISPNSGFNSPDPTGYSPSGGFTFGSSVSAGQVIYDASQAYGLNPQVLLATLQKEQSLITGSAGCYYNTPNPAAYFECALYGGSTQYNCTKACPHNGGCVNIAVGYGCPGNCNANEEGFSQQLIHAAWFLKFGENRSEGNISWDVQGNNFPESGDIWNNLDDPQSCYSGPMTEGTWQICPGGTSAYYGGYTSVDGVTTFISNGATAALYWYTPHFSGNQNFDSIFTQWFGSIYTSPYNATFYSQSNYPSLNPGQSAAVWFEYQNTGNQTWYDDDSIGSAPAGSYPVHLATSHILNRASAFSATWPSATRADLVFSTVYNSDGVTLASNQHVAQPGQIVKFSFTMTAPYGLVATTYPEYFIPVAEGTPTGSFNDPGAVLFVTVLKP
jgi:hypothetical protein